jgi:D-alanyl-D-alanine carboxypeptidase (penicillin-binding protein 5/6)
MRKFIFFALFSLQLFAEPLKVEVSAKSAILINAKTGAILFEKDAHRASFPASITKVATALYVLERKGNNFDEIATASHDCLATLPTHLKFAPDVPPYCLEIGGSHMGLRIGEKMDLKSLFYGLMLSSGNDSANVLAKHISGDIGKFMQEFNLFLRAKGFRETSFVNPHGLHHPDQQTTAYDMAFITREALKYPFFREVVKTVRYLRPKTNKQAESFLAQSNRLIKPGQYFYPKALGVKTGYVAKAGHTLVAAASHEGRELIAVVLGCPDINAKYRDTVKLFETAFAEKPVSRKLLTSAHDHFTCPIQGGKRPLEAQLEKDLVMTYFPAEELQVKVQVKWDCAALPVSKGQIVGHLELVTDTGTVYQSEPLLAVYDVNRTAWKAFTDFSKRHRNALLLTFLGLNVAAALFYFLKKPQKVA